MSLNARAAGVRAAMLCGGGLTLARVTPSDVWPVLEGGGARPLPSCVALVPGSGPLVVDEADETAGTVTVCQPHLYLGLRCGWKHASEMHSAANMLWRRPTTRTLGSHIS